MFLLHSSFFILYELIHSLILVLPRFKVVKTQIFLLTDAKCSLIGGHLIVWGFFSVIAGSFGVVEPPLCSMTVVHIDDLLQSSLKPSVFPVQNVSIIILERVSFVF